MLRIGELEHESVFPTPIGYCWCGSYDSLRVGGLRGTNQVRPPPQDADLAQSVMNAEGCTYSDPLQTSRFL
jgi:hypothetical protein